MPTHAQEQEHKTNTDERTKDKKITGYSKQDTTLQVEKTKTRIDMTIRTRYLS